MPTSMVSDSLKFAFLKLFKYWWIAIPRLLINSLLIGSFIFFLCIAGVYGYGLFSSSSTELKSIMLLFAAPAIILSISIISMGVVLIFMIAANTKITLDLYDQKRTPFFMFNQIGNGIIILCSAIILSIATSFSLLLLVFPAIYLSLRWMFFSYSIVDLNKGPFGALAHSWRITQVIKRPLFWISIIIVLVALIKVFLISKYGYQEIFNIDIQKFFTLESWKNTTVLLESFKTKSPLVLGLASLAIIIFASLAHLFIAGLYRKLKR